MVVVRTALVVVPVLVVALVAGYRHLYGDDGAVAVPANGGRVASPDGDVSVVFGPDEVSSGTRVRIRTGIAAPALPDLVVPMTDPFDITATAGHAATGTVTVDLGPLPADTDAARVVMLIDDGPDGWQLLDTTVDPTTGTVMARWPHFSTGVVGCLSPFGSFREKLKDCKKAVDTVAGAPRMIADEVVERLLPLTGGTADDATCEPAGTDWTFADARGPADRTLLPMLTGCAGPPKDNAWAARIGNQFPYPFLVSLPRGVTGPGAAELFIAGPPEESLLALGASLLDFAVVPGGGQTSVTIHAGAAPRLMFAGYMDPATLAVKAVIITAMIITRGKAAELKAAARAEMTMFEAQLRAGTANGRLYTRAEFVRDTGWDSPTARKERRAALGEAAPFLFAARDITLCALQAAREQSQTLSDERPPTWSREAFQEETAFLFSKCWPTFASAAAEFGTHQIGKKYTHPDVMVDKAKAIVGELVNAVRDLPRMAAATTALRVFAGTGGTVDALRATLVATRAGTPTRVAGLGALDWPAIARRHLTGCGDTGAVTLSRPDPVTHDLTGDGVPDTAVVLRCSPESKAGQLQVYDGASDPADPTLLGILTHAAKPGSPRLDFDFGATVEATGAEVSFRGALSLDKNESMFARQAFTWNGERFVPGELHIEYPD